MLPGSPFSWIKPLMVSQEISVLKSLHWLFRPFMKRNGYKWEIRRSGELKIGYWKKSFKKRDSHQAYPKRLVLIPGFGDSALSWQLVLSLLSPGLKKQFDEIILLDFPGFGGFLSQDRAFPSLNLLLVAVGDTLDSLKPHTILGHSLGGWLTAYYAAQCGGGIRPISNRLNYSGPNKILLISPSGIFCDPEMKLRFTSLLEKSLIHGFATLRPYLFLNEPIWFKYLAGHFTEFFKREDIAQFLHSFQRHPGLESFTAQIQCEVLLVWGESDTLIPKECAFQWVKLLTSGSNTSPLIVHIKKAGHSPQLEQPIVTSLVLGQLLSGKIPYRSGSRWWKVIRSA